MILHLGSKRVFSLWLKGQYVLLTMVEYDFVKIEKIL